MEGSSSSSVACQTETTHVSPKPLFLSSSSEDEAAQTCEDVEAVRTVRAFARRRRTACCRACVGRWLAHVRQNRAQLIRETAEVGVAVLALVVLLVLYFDTHDMLHFGQF